MWIGDVAEVNNILSIVLSKESEIQNEKYIGVAERARGIYREIKSDFKHEYRELSPQKLNHEQSIKFAKVVSNSDININDALGGAMLEKLQTLQQALKQYPSVNEIRKKDAYKYTLTKKGGKYEVRMLLTHDNPPNVNNLEKALNSLGFKTNRIGESKMHLMLAGFIDDAYIEAVVFDPCLSISLSLLNDSVEKAQAIAEKIMDSITLE